MSTAVLIVLGCIGLLAVCMVFLLCPQALAVFGGLLRNLCLVMGLLWVAGRLLGETYTVGLNGVTAVIGALLGLPGAVLLLLCKGFLL